MGNSLGSSMCYITGPITYKIPFEEKKKVYSSKTFSCNRHYLFARVVEEEETAAYRNLAVNVNDQHDVDCLKVYLRADFPHDSWWTRGTVTFSDDSTEILEFVKNDKAQTFHIASRESE